MTNLTAQVTVASRGVDAQVTVAAGHTLVLLGHNGSGKSTVVESIAGLVPLTQGRITLGDEVLDNVPAARTTTLPRRGHVAPRNRRIGLLSQDDALFDHMSVAENVAFGPRSRGMARSPARDSAATWLEKVGLADVAARRPHQLSGGQARRVAIARALAAEPRVLLLDEPFAGLDVVAASTIRALIARLLEGVTAVVATHDALDAHALADTVSVLEAGRVVESGDAGEVLTRPRTAFAARMAGRVLVAGPMRGGAIVTAAGVAVPVTGGPGAGSQAGIAVRPHDITVTTRPPTLDKERVWVPDAVVALEPLGDRVRIHGNTLTADAEAGLAAELTVGERAGFGIPRGERAYPL